MKSSRTKTKAGREPKNRVEVKTHWKDPSYLAEANDGFYLTIVSDDLKKGTPDDKFDCPIVCGFRRHFKVSQQDGYDHGLIMTRTVAWLPFRDETSPTGWIRLKFSHHDGLVALVDNGNMTPRPKEVHFIAPPASLRPGHLPARSRSTRYKSARKPWHARGGRLRIPVSALTGSEVVV